MDFQLVIMIKNIKYVKLDEVLSRCLRHPLLQDVDIEAAIQYAVDFIHTMGMPDMFEDKEAEIHIEDHRGLLPCDLISVNQVMNKRTKRCMRSTTDTFNPKDGGKCGCHKDCEDTFKTQNTVIITSFREGDVIMSYKAIPVDEEGFPLLIDNPTFIKGLELYIKKEVFTILFDQDKIKGPVLQNVQREYAWKVGQIQDEFNIPSESEMESICRSWNTLIQRTTDFDRGWKHFGDREYIRRH